VRTRWVEAPATVKRRRLDHPDGRAGTIARVLGRVLACIKGQGRQDSNLQPPVLETRGRCADFQREIAFTGPLAPVRIARRLRRFAVASAIVLPEDLEASERKRYSRWRSTLSGTASGVRPSDGGALSAIIGLIIAPASKPSARTAGILAVSAGLQPPGCGFSSARRSPLPRRSSFSGREGMAGRVDACHRRSRRAQAERRKNSQSALH
jgi:hypothetical protein